MIWAKTIVKWKIDILKYMSLKKIKIFNLGLFFDKAIFSLRWENLSAIVITFDLQFSQLTVFKFIRLVLRIQ